MSKAARRHRLTAVAALVLGAVLGAGEARAQQGAAPGVIGGAVRRVHVTTIPPGVRASAGGGMGGLLFASAVTPHSFSLPADGYGSIALGGPGFERARVAIPPGGHDLHLEVRMSRPVFEAGIALVSIFGAASVVGAVMMGLNAEALRNENIKDDGFFAGLWTLVVASPFLIAGVLMAILDRHRRPTWRWLDQPAL